MAAGLARLHPGAPPERDHRKIDRRSSTEGAPKIFELNLAGGRLVGDSSGEGPAIVLLHAGVADRRMWNHLVPELARAYQVIRFDFRGYGDSPPASEPYRPIDDVAAVLDLHGVTRAHLIGASMGGAVALDFALARPERVLSLSLLAPAVSGYDFSPAIEAYWEAEEAALERGDIEATVELNLDVWVRGNGREWTERSLAVAAELRDALRVIATNQSIVTNPSAGEDLELETEPARPRLAEVSVPALVVIAESDPVDLVAIGELLAATLPGARVVRMPDTAHLPALERPAETLATLVDFLAST